MLRLGLFTLCQDWGCYDIIHRFYLFFVEFAFQCIVFQISRQYLVITFMKLEGLVLLIRNGPKICLIPLAHVIGLGNI